MKKIIFLLSLFSLFSLSSCIKMDSNLVVNNDLTMDGIITFNYTQRNTNSKEYYSSGTGIIETKSSKIALPCDNVKSGSGGLSVGVYKIIKCENIDSNIAKVTAKGAIISKYVKIKDGNYFLDLKPIINDNISDKSKSEKEKIESLIMLKSMGFEMNYNITFPSKIIKTNIGKIDGNTLYYTIYDTIEINNPYIVFKKEGINNTNISIVIMKKKSLLFRNMIIFKKELEKTKKGELFKKAIDKKIYNFTDTKLIEIYKKLEKIDLNNSKFKKHKNILQYLEAKIGLEIYKRYLVEK